MLLPVVNVDISDTTNKKFEFTLVKHVNKVLRYELVEASEESIKLFIDTSLNPPLCDQTEG